MEPHEYDEAEVHRQFDDALARRGSYSGRRSGLGTIVWLAKQGGCPGPMRGGAVEGAGGSTAHPVAPFDLDAARPVYHTGGMPPRVFAGPEIADGVRLFPMESLSLVVALGGQGKTTFIMKMGAHIAAGKAWGSSDVRQRKVLIFNVEETQDDLNRKFGAAVHGWSDADREEALDHMRLVSCLGRDVRMTEFNGRQVDGTELTARIIQAAKQFNAEVIFIDHLQGFTSGDLNLSDTATALTREATKIVAETGAAVVFAAHTNKANVGAQGVDSGFTTGSLAFENAARQVLGIIPLPEEDAKKAGLEAVKQNYRKMELPKNSYGPDRAHAYLAKVHVPDFHTISVEPFDLPQAMCGHRISAGERLDAAILKYIAETPGTTPQALDRLAGVKIEPFKASREKIRKRCKALIADRRIRGREVDKEERKALGLNRQARKVYEVADGAVPVV